MTQYWQKWTKEGLWNFLRKPGEGHDVESRQWLKEQINGGHILDCGHGAGVDYENLRDRVDSYTGIDITPKMTELCQENFPEATWITGDLRDMPFEDQQFDTVICRAVLEHLPDYKEAIDELKRVGKRVIILLFHPLGRAKKVELGDGVYNNTYDKRLLKHVGDCEYVRLSDYDAIIWEYELRED